MRARHWPLDGASDREWPTAGGVAAGGEGGGGRAVAFVCAYTAVPIPRQLATPRAINVLPVMVFMVLPSEDDMRLI